MKKSFFACFFLLVTLTSTFAQVKPKNIKVDWGREMKEPSRSTITDLLVGDDGKTFAVRTKASGIFNIKYILEAYNEDLTIIASEELDLEYKGKDMEYEFIIFSNGKLYAFASFDNQKQDKNYLFAQEINQKTLKPQGAIQKVIETDSRSKSNEGKFFHEISTDKSKIAIFAMAAYKKKEKDKFNVAVLDADMNPLWNKDIKLPYTDELYNSEIVRVDNNGNFYMQGVLFQDKAKTKRKGKPNYSYLIHSYRDKGEKVKEYKISLKDRFITDLNFKVSKSDKIICAGFYSDKGTYAVKGTYFIRIDLATGEKEVAKTKAFEDDFLAQFLSDRQIKKGKKELYQYDVDKLILRGDGGAVLLAEQYFVRSRTITRTGTNGTMSSRTVYYYYYNDIIAINIKPDGDVEWLTKIPKRQVTIDDGGYYSSFADMITNEKIYLIFNDNPKNIRIKDSKRIYNFNGKKSVVTLATISKDGSYEKSILLNNRDQEVITRPKVCEQTSKDEMILYGELRKKFRLARVTF